jgi:hypothetical protein
MLSLFSFDIIMALAKVIYIKWVHEGKVYTGRFCTVQGVVQQLGDTGSALATLGIAVHTFLVVVWGRNTHPYFTAYAIVSITWLFLALFVAITVTVHTHGSDFYETPVGYWCWIGNHHKAEQYAGQYAWVWLTMFVSFLTYTILFFWARGNLTVSPTCWWKIRVHKDKDVVNSIDPNTRKRTAMGMIAYPVVFAVVALPLSVVRWTTAFGSGQHHLPAATFAVEIIYSLSGALNVLLFLFTRSELLLPRNLSNKRQELGMASGVTVSVTTSRHAEVYSRELSFSKAGGRQQPRGDQPIPLESLPETDDMAWHSPMSEHDSYE